MTDAGATPGTIVLLTRLSRLVYRRSTSTLLGMSLKQFVTLNHLADEHGSSQQALGEWLGLDANNLVLLLNDLEAEGHVIRRRDPADRRRHIVEITPVGRKALASAEAAMETVEDDVLAGLDASERTSLARLLARALGSSGSSEAAGRG